jgi:hypothetical protein
MKGLELSRKFYETYGAPMLHEKFPELEDKLAIGLVGDGSECFGYDDDISRDHDFEPGFCIFVPDDIDSRTEFQLERAYAKLPKSFEGVDRLKISPVGGSRHGVIKTGDFYLAKTGSRTGFDSVNQWMTTPDSCLAAATNGEVFRDDLGEFSRIRRSFIDMPQDVRLKKLAGHLIMAAQAGQYNFKRCISHGETGGAQLAMIEFADHAMSAVFLLNRKYRPFYKWAFRAMRELEKLSELADTFEFLISSDNEPVTASAKADIVEDIASMIITELQNQSLTDAICGDLEKHAYSVNDRISSTQLRTMHIMAGV